MLSSMNIHPEYRGQKLGLDLLNIFNAFLNENNISETFCLPYSHLLNFYAQIGFVSITEEQTPPFLQERLKIYREKFPEKLYSVMRRRKNNFLTLETPSLNLYKFFMAFIEDMRVNNQTLWEPYLPKPTDTPELFIQRLCERSTHPESPFVPETVYWAVFNMEVVGRISLRHRLEGNLHKLGGHIGYEVGPKWRRKGFATEMLRLILLTHKAKEIGKLLLTCSPTNEASNKTIQRNGGIFVKKVFVDFINEDRNHYWVDSDNHSTQKDPTE